MKQNFKFRFYDYLASKTYKLSNYFERLTHKLDEKSSKHWIDYDQELPTQRHSTDMSDIPWFVRDYQLFNGVRQSAKHY